MPADEITNETTNAVLKEMIISLTKITDERFSNLKDALIEIKILMQGYATKTELEETKRDFNSSIKRIEDGFEKHNQDDILSFGKIDKKQDKLQNVILLGMGGLAVVVFAIQYIIPLIWHH